MRRLQIELNKTYQSLKTISGEWTSSGLDWYYYWSYMLFLEDNKLIYVSSPQDVDAVNKWIKNSEPNGTYSIDSKGHINITITPNSNIQLIVMKGIIGKGKRLILNCNLQDSKFNRSWLEFSLEK